MSELIETADYETFHCTRRLGAMSMLARALYAMDAQVCKKARRHDAERALW
jgi:hypothetical protein